MKIELAKFIAALPCGFLTSETTPRLIALDPHCLVLVRLGMGRLLCPAQDLKHIMECVKAGGDYVRDVSINTSTLDEARRVVAVESVAPAGIVFAGSSVARVAADPHLDPEPTQPRSYIIPREAEFDERHARRVVREWDERDCSGAFDGSQVTSDADQGL